MSSTVKKIFGGGQKKATPAAATPSKGFARAFDEAKADKAAKAENARRGMLGRGAEDREQRVGVRDSLGTRAESLGVPTSAEIQGNRRFKREGAQGASRRLLS